MTTCACGCGQVPARIMVTDRSRGRVKGQRSKFVRGHEHRVYRPLQWNAHEPAWYRERERRRA